MTKFDEIKAEALDIARISNKLRHFEIEQRKKDGGKTPRPMNCHELSTEDLHPRGEPSPTEPASEIFDEAIRFWAQRVAPEITHDQWEDMIWSVSEEIPDFHGNVISFFVNQFEMLTLKDGMQIFA